MMVEQLYQVAARSVTCPQRAERSGALLDSVALHSVRNLSRHALPDRKQLGIRELKFMQKNRLSPPLYLSFDSQDRPLIDIIHILSECTVLPDQPKPEQLELFYQLQDGYVFELMWVLKNKIKLWKRTVYPFNDPVCQVYESGGQIMSARLNLCQEVLDFFPNMPYTTHWRFWGLVELEQKINFLVSAFSGLDKWELEQKEQIIINKLSKWENPYRPDDSLVVNNHNLIGAAIDIGKEQEDDSREIRKLRKQFSEKFWVPYLKALRRHLRELQEGVRLVEFKSICVKAKDLIVHMGSRNAGENHILVSD